MPDLPVVALPAHNTTIPPTGPATGYTAFPPWIACPHTDFLFFFFLFSCSSVFIMGCLRDTFISSHLCHHGTHHTASTCTIMPTIMKPRTKVPCGYSACRISLIDSGRSFPGSCLCVSMAYRPSYIQLGHHTIAIMLPVTK